MTARTLIAAACLMTASCGDGTTSLTQQQQDDWVNQLIPLPREIAIERVVAVESGRVRVRTRANASPAEQTAAAELASLLADSSASGEPGFEIVLGILDADGRLENLSLPAEARRLRSLPNPEQAYVIRPLETRGLVLASLGEQGVYYAAQTLRQLLEGRVSDGRVSLPLARITDWPAIEQRGLWEDVFSRDELEWLASLKFSAVNVHARLGMTDEGRGSVRAGLVRRPPADIESSYPAFCRSHGIRCIPIITHLSHLARTDLYDHHPELRGQGESAQHPTKSGWVGPCTSQPGLARVLAEWMEALADDHGADEISVWLSEEHVRCSCERCAALGQYVGETRAILAGWRLARERHPGLKLQLLLTQGSYPHNEAVLREIPPGGQVRVVYYDGGRTYDASREPMIYPLLEQFAGDGGWLGVYPQFTASWAFVLPWSAPQFMRARMTEFADKGLGAVIGYAVPNPGVHDFNVAAAAEWSWNPRGRSAHDFALAWATRRGSADPRAVADWADVLGPVSWDVFGSKFPLFFVWDDPAQFIGTGARPALGEYVFRYFPTFGHFDLDLAACARALDIARGLGEPELLQETLVVEGYVRMLRELYLISDGSGALDEPTGEQLLPWQAHLEELAAARDQVNAALVDWGGDRGVGEVSRFRGTLDVNDRLVRTLGAAIDSLAGVSD